MDSIYNINNNIQWKTIDYNKIKQIDDINEANW